MAQDVPLTDKAQAKQLLEAMQAEYRAAYHRRNRLLGKGREIQAKALEGFEYTPDDPGAWLTRADQKKLSASMKRMRQLEPRIDAAWRQMGIKPGHFKYDPPSSGEVKTSYKSSESAPTGKAAKKPAPSAKTPAAASKVGKVAKVAGKAARVAGKLAPPLAALDIGMQLYESATTPRDKTSKGRMRGLTRKQAEAANRSVAGNAKIRQREQEQQPMLSVKTPRGYVNVPALDEQGRRMGPQEAYMKAYRSKQLSKTHKTKAAAEKALRDDGLRVRGTRNKNRS